MQMIWHIKLVNVQVLVHVIEAQDRVTAFLGSRAMHVNEVSTRLSFMDVTFINLKSNVNIFFPLLNI